MSTGRSPDHIEQQIEQTREELGATVEALAAKTDVKAAARRKLSGAGRRAPVVVTVAGAGGLIAGAVLLRRRRAARARAERGRAARLQALLASIVALAPGRGE